MEGIRAREVLLLPQTLKNRRQLVHKLLRYTINEMFRNIPFLLLVRRPSERCNFRPSARANPREFFFTRFKIILGQKFDVPCVAWTGQSSVVETTHVARADDEVGTDVQIQNGAERKSRIDKERNKFREIASPEVRYSLFRR